MKLFDDSNKIVIKVGSSFLVNPNNLEVNNNWIDSFVDDVVDLIKKGKKIIIVSSGAIALGCKILKLDMLKMKLQEKQNVSVCGQHEMIDLYKKSFARHDIKVAQALITIEDIENRKRFLSIKTTLDYLLEHNIVPIINENDLIANTEIRFGDNDRLSARVCQIASANLLVMLSIVDGLFTDDPKLNPHSRLISEIYDISSDIETMASDSKLKTGGMSAKVVSAKIAMNNNASVIVANGSCLNPIRKVIDGSSRCSQFILNKESSQKYKID